MDGNSEVLDAKGAASELGLTVQTLARWRVEGRGPKYMKLGGAVRYTRDAIDNYRRDCERSSTSDRRQPSASGAAA